MPQLDPSPWLFIFSLSWTALLTFLPPKVMAHQFPNTPLAEQKEIKTPTPWVWPWL